MLKRAWLLLLLMVVLPCLAWAQDDAAADDDAAAIAEGASAAEEEASTAGEDYDYVPYATSFGFSIRLPADGVITDPSAPDWAGEEEVAFEWTATDQAPITLIRGRVDGFESALGIDTFQAFCDTLLSVWSADTGQFTVVTANDQLTINEQVWNLIEVADLSDGPDEAVHFSVFSTFAGDSIYTVSMYYLQPLSREVQEFGIPVIYGFSLTGGE